MTHPDFSPPLPPKRLRFTNESDDRFMAVGDQTVEQLQAWAGLSAQSHVVDVGCGYGRLAHALLRRPDFQGSYLGLDILPRHLRWCSRKLSRLAPGRFVFKPIDVQNDRYNPSGKVNAANAKLPVPDRSADVVVFLSVFTHMFPEQVTNYLREARRMLTSNGRVFATFLLMNHSWQELAREAKPAYPLPHQLTEFARIMNAKDPLHAIAYREDWVVDQFQESQLSVAEPIHYGTWAGRSAGDTFQDLILARPS